MKKISELTDAKDVLYRLQQYSPPDRTVDAQRQAAQDILDATSEIKRLRAENADLLRGIDIRDIQIRELQKSNNELYEETEYLKQAGCTCSSNGECWFCIKIREKEALKQTAQEEGK